MINTDRPLMPVPEQQRGSLVTGGSSVIVRIPIFLQRMKRDIETIPWFKLAPERPSPAILTASSKPDIVPTPISLLSDRSLSTPYSLAPDAVNADTDTSEPF